MERGNEVVGQQNNQQLGRARRIVAVLRRLDAVDGRGARLVRGAAPIAAIIGVAQEVGDATRSWGQPEASVIVCASILGVVALADLYRRWHDNSQAGESQSVAEQPPQDTPPTEQVPYNYPPESHPELDS